MPSFVFFLSILSSLPLRANAVNMWFIPNTQNSPVCDASRDFGPPRTFQADCQALAALLRVSRGEPQDAVMLWSTLTVENRPYKSSLTNAVTNKMPHKESHLDWNSCLFTATEWHSAKDTVVAGITNKFPTISDYWMHLWPSFLPFLDLIRNLCVKQEKSVDQYRYMTYSPQPLSRSQSPTSTSCSLPTWAQNRQPHPTSPLPRPSLKS